MNMLAMDWFSHSAYIEEYEDNFFSEEETFTDDEKEEYEWEFQPETTAKSQNTPHDLYTKHSNVIQLQPSCRIAL